MFNGDRTKRARFRPLVVEYLERKALVELGFTSSLGSIPATKADALLVIHDKWCDLREKKRTRESKRKKHAKA